jgi:hypothetical protein
MRLTNEKITPSHPPLRVSEVWMLAAAVSLFSACATTGPRVEVKSTPEGAEVAIVRPNGSGTIPIGKTPLSLSPDQFPDLGAKLVTLQIRKDGYQLENIVLPDGATSGLAQMNFTLRDSNVSPTTGKAFEATQNELARGIAQIHRQVSKKNFDDAIRTLDALLARHPRIATLYDLLGGIHYLRKDSSRALDAFKRSLELDPNNAETSRLVEKLQAFQGRMPAETGDGG